MAPSAAGLPIMSAVSHMLAGSRRNPSASATLTSWYFSVAARTSASVGSPGPGDSSASTGRTNPVAAAAVMKTLTHRVLFMASPLSEGAIEALGRDGYQRLLRERLERQRDQERADAEAEAGDEEPGIA